MSGLEGVSEKVLPRLTYGEVTTTKVSKMYEITTEKATYTVVSRFKEKIQERSRNDNEDFVVQAPVALTGATDNDGEILQ